MAIVLGRQTAAVLLSPMPRRDPTLPQQYERISTGGVVESLRDVERYESDFKFSGEAIALVILRNGATEGVTSDWRAEVGGHNWRVTSVDQPSERQLRLLLDREAASE